LANLSANISTLCVGAAAWSRAVSMSTSPATLPAKPVSNMLFVFPAGSTNSMLLTGFPGAVAGIVDMLVTLDQAAAPTQTAEIFALKFAHAGDAFGALRSIFKRATRTADDGSVVPIGPVGPTFTLDERTNSILVYASARELALIGRVLTMLDVETK
jgi:type II secretory pathway component GspD/PulD (secretin)